MSRERELVKNTAIIAIGKISAQIVSFILLPVYTALLTTSDYGIVDLLNTYVSLLVPVVTLQMEQALFRYLLKYRNDAKEKTRLISSACVSICIQLCIFGGLYLSIAFLIDSSYKVYLVANIVAYAITSVFMQIARGLGDNIGYAMGSFIMAAGTLTFNIIFVIGLKKGAAGMLLANLAAHILCAVVLFFREGIWKYFKISSASIKVLKELLSYSVPLIFNTISWWIFNVSDRTIITLIMGISANGIYSVANKFSGLYITFYNVFNLSWTESVALHINDEDASEYLSQIMETIFRLFSSITIGIIACMPVVFPIMINSKFSDAYFQIPILMTASLFFTVSGLYGAIYIARMKTKDVAKTSMIAAVINVLINLLFIKRIGIYAASISTAAAYGFLMLFRIIGIRKYMRISVSKKVVLSTIIMLIVVYVGYYINRFSITVFLIGLAVIYAILLNRKFLMKLIRYRKINLKG